MNKSPVAIIVVTFLAMTFMKFRVASITLSDILMIACFAFIFVRYGTFKFSFFSYFFSCFVALAVLLAVLNGSSDGLLSAIKLIVPLFIIMASGQLFFRCSAENLLTITKSILFFGVITQLIAVALFYSGFFEPLFNIVEPGNLTRSSSGFQLNVFHVPLIGLYRFCSVFIEPSWFAFFFGFFLIVYFYQIRQAGLKIPLREDVLIICAFLFTLSFTGLIFLMFGYAYRFLDKRYPIRLIICVPLVIILLVSIVITNDYLAHRVYLISTGNDGSFNARIFASMDKALFILNYTDMLGSGPGKTLDIINRYFQENMSIQNAYFEAFASMGILGGCLFILLMHYSFILYRNIFLQIPLVLALSVSSVIFTPIFWMLSFYLLSVARVHRN